MRIGRGTRFSHATSLENNVSFLKADTHTHTQGTWNRSCVDREGRPYTQYVHTLGPHPNEKTSSHPKWLQPLLFFSLSVCLCLSLALSLKLIPSRGEQGVRYERGRESTLMRKDQSSHRKRTRKRRRERKEQDERGSLSYELVLLFCC